MKNHIHGATHYGEMVLLKIENFVNFCVFFFQRLKQLTFFRFKLVKYFDKRLSFLKIWHMRTNYVEITGRRASYFVSFDTTYRDLTTDKGKQQQTRRSNNYSCRVTLP